MAILPEWQGRGLSKPLLSAVMNLLIKTGHSSALLRTKPFRIVAINLYLNFGFEPFIETDEDLQKWRQITRLFEQKKVPSDAIHRKIAEYNSKHKLQE